MPSIASSSPEVLIATSARQYQPHPRRLGRRHAAQPRAAARRRDLPHAQRPPSRPHRSRHRPRRRQRWADAERAALGRWQLLPAGDGRAAGLRAGQLSRPTTPIAPIRVVPEHVELPPIYLLGSSGASAAAAGELGVGYSFAAHFSATPAGPGLRRLSRRLPALGAVRQAARHPRRVGPRGADRRTRRNSSRRSQAVSWALFHSGDERRLMAPEEAASCDADAAAAGDHRASSRGSGSSATPEQRQGRDRGGRPRRPAPTR